MQRIRTKLKIKEGCQGLSSSWQSCLSSRKSIHFSADSQEGCHLGEWSERTEDSQLKHFCGFLPRSEEFLRFLDLWSNTRSLVWCSWDLGVSLTEEWKNGIHWFLFLWEKDTWSRLFGSLWVEEIRSIEPGLVNWKRNGWLLLMLKRKKSQTGCSELDGMAPKWRTTSVEGDSSVFQRRSRCHSESRFTAI